MNIRVERKAFLESFALAASASKAKSTLEIIKNVLVDAREGYVLLTATDTQVWATVQAAGAEVVEVGTVLLDAEKAKQVLEGMRGDAVTIELVRHQAVLSDGRTKVTLPTDDPRKFPGVPDAARLPASWPITSAQLAIVAQRVGYATSTRTNSAALAGVGMEVDEKTMAFLALDGNRLVRKEFPNDGPADEVVASIPPDAFRLAAKVFDAAEGCAISFSGPSLKMPHMVHFVAGPASVSSRLCEGRFPNWRLGIPPASQKRGTARVNVGDVVAAIRVASIATSEESRAIWLDFSESGLTVSGSASDRGDAQVPVDCAYQGAPFRVRVDHQYASQSFSKLDPASDVEIDLHVARDPSDVGLVLVRAEGNMIVGISPINTAK